jgi:hypothetical protein
MNPTQALAMSRMSGPLGIPDRQLGMAYGVLGFGGSMITSRALLASTKVSRPVAVAVPVVSAGLIALLLGLPTESSLDLVIGSLVGSVLGIVL